MEEQDKLNNLEEKNLIQPDGDQSLELEAGSVKKNSKLIIIAAIFLIFILGGGVFAWQKMSSEKIVSNTNDQVKSELDANNVIQPNMPVIFSGWSEKTIFTDDIFAYIFGYPSEQLNVVEELPSPGYSVITTLSLNKTPYSEVVKLSTFSKDLLEVDPASNGQEYIENYSYQDGQYKIDYLAKSYEVKPSKVIESDFGEIIVINGIEVANDILKFGEDLGYLALMKSGNENYLPINIVANKEFVSYEEFINFLETIKKANFQFSQENCPAPEITSWGEGMAQKNTFLKLCGRKTYYPAVMFQEQGFILFNQDDILKTVNIKPPFKEEVLINGIKLVDLESAGVVSGDFYTVQMIADGPGSLKRVFTFKPNTKEFIYVNNSIFGGKSGVDFASSYSDKVFSASITTGCAMGSCEVYDAMSDSDIQAYINGKPYTKKQVSQNLDNIAVLSSCVDYFDVSKIYEYPPYGTIDVENFPPKRINCLDYDNKDLAGNPSIKAYFDLEQSNFVVIKSN